MSWIRVREWVRWVGCVGREGWGVEKRGVCPIVVDCSPQSLLLVRAEKATVVTPKAPAETGVDLSPTLCSAAEVYHLLHMLQSELRLVGDSEDARKGHVDTDFGANGFPAWGRLVAKDELEEGG